jgi:hypothetical protein
MKVTLLPTHLSVAAGNRTISSKCVRLQQPVYGVGGISAWVMRRGEFAETTTYERNSMLKNSFFAALVAALVMSVAACGDSADSKPNDAMKKVEAAFESLDPAKLEAVYDADTWKSKGASMTEDFKKMKENGEKVDLTWTESDVVVSGDTATVKTKMTITDKDGKAEDEAETFSFRKTDAGWKCTG